MLGVDPKLDFEVHELRRSLRVGPDGQHIPQIIVALTQATTIDIDSTPHTFRGGSTLVVDLSKPGVDYAIRKDIKSEKRQERTAAFVGNALRDPLQALLIRKNREPFAALHAFADVAS